MIAREKTHSRGGRILLYGMAAVACYALFPHLFPSFPAEKEAAAMEDTARELIAIYERAEEIGVSFQGETLSETVENVVKGHWFVSGVLAGRYIGASHLEGEDLSGVMDLLALQDGVLRFNPFGGVEPGSAW